MRKSPKRRRFFVKSSDVSRAVIVAPRTAVADRLDPETEPPAGLEEARHLLLVENDPALRQRLASGVRRHGYRTSAVADAADAARLTQTFLFDACVAGMQVAAELADQFATTSPFRTPLVRLSPHDVQASQADLVRIIGARLSRALRRAAFAPAAARVRMGLAEFDLLKQHLIIDGRFHPLTGVEAMVLRRMALHPHRPLPRHRLRPDLADGRSVDVSIARLRKILEPSRATPRYIRTIRGAGYMLTPDAPIGAMEGLLEDPGNCRGSEAQ